MDLGKQKEAHVTGEPIENFVLPDLEGNPVRLDKVKGRVVLLNFWASWCAPCLKEFPVLIDLVLESQGRISLVAISNDESVAEAQKFIGDIEKDFQLIKKHPNIKVLWDENHKMTHQVFNVLSLPETFILDADRKILRKVVGAAEWEKPELLNYIKNL